MIAKLIFTICLNEQINNSVDRNIKLKHGKRWINPV